MDRDTHIRHLGTQFADRLTVAENVPLSDYSTFRIGGPAALLLSPKDTEVFCGVIRYCKQLSLPFRVLGRGSNILPSDEGFDGVVISTRDLRRIRCDGNCIRAEAGATIQQVLHLAKDRSLSGLEKLAGIPGTVGGAIYMNAGAYGVEISDLLTGATVYDYEKEAVVTMRNAELSFSYRDSLLQRGGHAVLEGTFALQNGDAESIAQTVRETLQKRRMTQPLAFPNAGSIFKRPEGDFAGRLIEVAGLKGTRVGGAVVSELHAGFIVNEGNATAADVRTLIAIVQERVWECSGVRLACEVEIW